MAYSVSQDLLISDLSHENPSIFAGAYRPYQRTFGDVPVGKPLVYVNSLLNLAVALNQGSYAAARKIDSGPDWSIEIGKD